jgi:hypothetical protein
VSKYAHLRPSKRDAGIPVERVIVGEKPKPTGRRRVVTTKQADAAKPKVKTDDGRDENKNS